MLDLLITGGTVYDGSGGEPYAADIGVLDGRVAAIGHLAEAPAARTISGSGKAVAPGFIDMHSHADLNLLVAPEATPKLLQGVTTEIVGHCGLGPAPTNPATVQQWRRSVAGVLGDSPEDWSWPTLDSYLADLEQARPALNVAALVTHGAIRAAVLGLEDRTPGASEQEKMATLVERSLVEGAFGMSVGLAYLPCFFAAEPELVSLYRRVADHGGLMVIHIRNQADGVLDALAEAISIAASAGVSLHVSHLCVAGRRNWGKSRHMLAMIDRALIDGQDVSFDQHPYDAGSTMLSQVLPGWAVAGGNEALTRRLSDADSRGRIKQEIAADRGTDDPRNPWQNFATLVGWENILISSVHGEVNRQCVGQTIAEFAAARCCDPADATMDLLLEEQGMVTMVILNAYSAEDIALIMRHEAQMVGSDDLYTGRPHPRLYGTFPRILGKFAREEGVIGLAEAVRKMTSVPARRLGLTDRGVLREKAIADLVVFDPATVRDCATYTVPEQFPIGIEYVLVNGHLAVDGGKQTTARSGVVLRRG